MNVWPTDWLRANYMHGATRPMTESWCMRCERWVPSSEFLNEHSIWPHSDPQTARASIFQRLPQPHGGQR